MIVEKSGLPGLGPRRGQQGENRDSRGRAVQKGQIAPEQSKALVNQLVERGQEEQASFSASIQDMVKRKLQDFDMAASSDLIALKQRMMMLEQRIDELEGASSDESGDEDGQPNMETDGCCRLGIRAATAISPWR
ncbi:hypothetical protein ABE142_00795 [Paenibacillus alvei]|uniref:hypothetical protein n=1 Tax=Paenibacillus alvei TaxID=44250 RepID=UPI003D2C1208